MDKKITYTNEVVDEYSGQLNYEAGIYLNGEIIGMVQYVLYDEELTVSDILVRPEYRRQGYGSRLIKYIKEENPDYEYKPSIMKPDGAKFIHKDLFLEESIKAKFVYENINFERGQDPKKAMDIGVNPIEIVSPISTHPVYGSQESDSDKIHDHFKNFEAWIYWNYYDKNGKVYSPDNLMGKWVSFEGELYKIPNWDELMKLRIEREQK